MNDPSTSYEDEFYKKQMEGSSSSARKVVMRQIWVSTL